MDYATVEEDLDGLPAWPQRVLLSSSSLEDRILSRSVLGRLQSLAESNGFQLVLSYCIRDRQSWLNFVYAHRFRCFREMSGYG